MTDTTQPPWRQLSRAVRTEILVGAAWQVLCDMGAGSGTMCSAQARAELRIALEAFVDPDEVADLMPIEEARKIARELNRR